MPAHFHNSIRAGALVCAAFFLAAPAAAQCWSGGTSGQGVPRESLLVTNRAPFAVNVMAGAAGAAQRMLGQVPAGTTMSFASVLPPGRNDTTVWIDPADQDKYKLPRARTTGTIMIANRKDLTCRRAATLEVTPATFAGTQRRATTTNVARRAPAAPAAPTSKAARRTDLSHLAPAAAPRPAATPADTANNGSMRGREPGEPTGGTGIVRY